MSNHFFMVPFEYVWCTFLLKKTWKPGQEFFFFLKIKSLRKEPKFFFFFGWPKKLINFSHIKPWLFCMPRKWPPMGGKPDPLYCMGGFMHLARGLLFWILSGHRSYFSVHVELSMGPTTWICSAWRDTGPSLLVTLLVWVRTTIISLALCCSKFLETGSKF